MKYLFLSLLVLFLTGCADEVTLQQAIGMDQVGFWYGLWHGISFPISFIGSLFSDISIYAIYNNGGWYDFGFFLGVGSFSASALSS
ncbi:MAG: hypothetical protein KUG81_03205 [Gammaproteobacteria bacterium]|nr:hypothetical protein [Gammaproteobacteria bacterium]